MSFHSANFPEIDLLDLIQNLSEVGYDAIEINAAKLPYADPHVETCISDDEIKKIVEALNKNNIKISAFSAHSNLVDPVLKKSSLQYTKRCIDIAVKLGADIVQGSSGIKPEEISDEEAWETLTENLNKILDYAEQNNIKFTFEPVVVMFVNNGKMFKELNNRIKHRLYMNFDPSQHAVVGDPLIETIREFTDYIVHAHIKDAKGTQDSFKFPPLGDGVVNFKEVAKELKKIGFDGYYSIEYEAHVFGYEKNKEDVIDRSLQFLHEL